MEYATFKKWLTERGCRFDTQPQERGEGHGTMTIHREGRTADLLLVGARHELDPRSVRRVCEALGLKWSVFPDRRAALNTSLSGRHPIDGKLQLAAAPQVPVRSWAGR